MLFLEKQKEARYSKLKVLFESRATLDYALRELNTRGLVKRTLMDTRPVQSFYSLTPKGREAVEHLGRLLNAVLGPREQK
ncbi:MAG TPA: winged helix-turn-helix transcriptional regulator [Nitrososphaerales archaeon]|nr:winged helix-turn-helix transcriptional regulator [Nitrososphaerales archaeon]